MLIPFRIYYLFLLFLLTNSALAAAPASLLKKHAEAFESIERLLEIDHFTRQNSLELTTSILRILRSDTPDNNDFPSREDEEIAMSRIKSILSQTQASFCGPIDAEISREVAERLCSAVAALQSSSPYAWSDSVLSVYTYIESAQLMLNEGSTTPPPKRRGPVFSPQKHQTPAKRAQDITRKNLNSIDFDRVPKKLWETLEEQYARFHSTLSVEFPTAQQYFTSLCVDPAHTEEYYPGQYNSPSKVGKRSGDTDGPFVELASILDSISKNKVKGPARRASNALVDYIDGAGNFLDIKVFRHQNWDVQKAVKRIVDKLNMVDPVTKIPMKTIVVVNVHFISAEKQAELRSVLFGQISEEAKERYIEVNTEPVLKDFLEDPSYVNPKAIIN